MSATTPAEGYARLAEDLLEKTRLEGTLLAASRTLSDIQTVQLTKDERDMLALVKDSLGDLMRSVHQRFSERAREVVKAEKRALTRKCQVGGGHPHYWLDEPGRKANEYPPAAEKYEFAIPKVCPQHEAGPRY